MSKVIMMSAVLLVVFCVTSPVGAMESKTNTPVGAMAELIVALGEAELQAEPVHLQYVTTPELAFACMYVVKEPVVDFGMMIMRPRTKCHFSVAHGSQTTWTGKAILESSVKSFLDADEQYLAPLFQDDAQADFCYFGLPTCVTTLVVLLQTSGDQNGRDISDYERYKKRVYEFVKQVYAQGCLVYFVEAEVASIKEVAQLIGKIYKMKSNVDREKRGWLEQFLYQRGGRELPETIVRMHQVNQETPAHQRDGGMNFLANGLMTRPLLMGCQIL